MYTTPDRALVIDECLAKRLATELGYRGRQAVSVYALGLKGSKDPQLVPKLVAMFNDPVLVTADDHLPEDHAEMVASYKPTLAIIEPGEDIPDELQDAYEREIVHRWAHLMHEQESGTVLRYRLNGRPLKWRKPKNPK
jgi:predicted nuclease of predicted toxin-antitoxin system